MIASEGRHAAIPKESETTTEPETALWAAFKSNGSRSAREALFARHSGFARAIAGRLYRQRTRGDLELGDLVQLAFAGLLEALDRFEPARSIPFRPFAAHRITGSVLDGIARSSEVREQLSWSARIRRERLKSLQDEQSGSLSPVEQLAELAVGLALGFILEGTGLMCTETEKAESAGQATAYESVAWQEMASRLQSELAQLPEREQSILREHYVNAVGFDQIADLMCLSKGRISQLHRGALVLLRKRLRAHGHFRIVQ